jgi:tetratricopeptide (TPR) repeat protein
VVERTLSLERAGRAGVVLLAATFALRAILGVPAAVAFRQGRQAAGEGRLADAARALPRGAFGADRSEAKWFEGQVALGAWDARSPADRSSERARHDLERAASAFLCALRAVPASGWPVAGLAGVYLRREQAARASRVVDLAELDRGPWALLGDDGRVGVGLLRRATEREPTNFEFRDQLVLELEANGLHEEAVRAMRDAAAVLPNFAAHEAFSFESLPRDVVEAFYEESRARTGRVPLQLLERQLLSLAQLGRRLGRLTEAEADLRRALTASGSEIFHAEDAFHLALTLIDQGRGAEAEAFLARADAVSVFSPEVAAQRARIAERAGRDAEALEHLRRARALEPRNLRYCLEFARVAIRQRAWEQAREALKWGMVVDPGSPEPWRGLVEVSLAAGDPRTASAELDAYVGRAGETPDAVRLRAELARLLDSPGP